MGEEIIEEVTDLAEQDNLGEANEWILKIDYWQLILIREAVKNKERYNTL